jgi:hypothetical protein
MACEMIDLSYFNNITNYSVVTEQMKNFLDEVEKFDGTRYTPLHVAIDLENVTLLQSILDTHEFDDALKDILTFALMDNETDEIWKKVMCGWETFKCLVDAGANVHCKDWEDNTLLDMTYSNCGCKQSDIVKIRNYLRRQGVKYTIRKREKEEEKRYEDERKCREQFMLQHGYDAFREKYFKDYPSVDEDDESVPEFDGTEEEYEEMCAREEKRYPNEF